MDLKPVTHRKRHLKALALIFLVFFLPYACFCHAPLFKPLGAFVLNRLWDVLNFVVLTTAVSIGIFNSRGREAAPIERRARARQISGLGAAIFGDAEPYYNDHDCEPEPPHGRSVRASADEAKSCGGAVAWLFYARELIGSKVSASFMAVVTHIAFVLNAAENLASDSSASLQQKDRLQNAHAADVKLGDASESKPGNAIHKLHKKASSIDSAEIAKLDQGRCIRRNLSFSLDSEAKLVETGGEEGCGNGVRTGTDTSDDRLSSPLLSSPTVAAPTTGTVERRSSISRSINVIRPSVLNRLNDEEMEIADRGSPNDVDVQAEAFIAKVKEQMRLQTEELVEREKKKRLARAI